MSKLNKIIRIILEFILYVSVFGVGALTVVIGMPHTCLQQDLYSVERINEGKLLLLVTIGNIILISILKNVFKKEEKNE